MALKKKGNYTCKSKVQCLNCGRVILSENQGRHSRLIHGGDKVKFRIHNDAKQPRLMFSVAPKNDINANTKSVEH